MNSAQVRLQKWLSEMGVGSRHEAERWIELGRLQVNGKTAQLGDKVDPDGKNHVTLDGIPVAIKKAPPKVYWIMHKPDMILTSRAKDEEGKLNIYELGALKAKSVLVNPVGRLDFRTEGLLLLTNDGDLCYRLSHPSFGLERRYHVLIAGKLTKEQEHRMTHGVDLADGTAQCQIIYGGGVTLGGSGGSWYRVTVKEGRNRLVRRMFEDVGFKVVKLIRFGFGPISLPHDLKPGEVRSLKQEQVDALFVAASGVKIPAPPKSQGQRSVTKPRRAIGVKSARPFVARATSEERGPRTERRPFGRPQPRSEEASLDPRLGSEERAPRRGNRPFTPSQARVGKSSFGSRATSEERGPRTERRPFGRPQSRSEEASLDPRLGSEERAPRRGNRPFTPSQARVGKSSFGSRATSEERGPRTERRPFGRPQPRSEEASLDPRLGSEERAPRRGNRPFTPSQARVGKSSFGSRATSEERGPRTERRPFGRPQPRSEAGSEERAPRKGDRSFNYSSTKTRKPSFTKRGGAHKKQELERDFA